MTTVGHSTNDRRAARILVRLLAVLAALAVAVLFVAVSALVDTDRVASKQDLASVDLGVPMPWLHQDQSMYDPPLPYRMGMQNPMDNSTTVSFGTFLADVAVVFAIVAFAMGLLMAVVRVARPSRQA